MQSVSNGNYNTQRPSVEGERYTELPPFFQDSIFGYKQKVKQEMLGNDAHLLIHDQNATIIKNDPNFPVKVRK